MTALPELDQRDPQERRESRNLQERPDTRNPVLELVAGLPLEELDRRLQDGRRMHEVGNRVLAFYLDDLQERRLYQSSGHRSAVHYAESRLGISKRKARTLLAVGKALGELPLVDEAFRTGQLGWSKVRALCEVVVPATQAAWIERAVELACSRLELEVRAAERGRGPREDGLGLPRVRFRVHASLDALTHEKWEHLRRRYQAQEERPISDDELASILIDRAVHGEADEGTHAEEPFRIVVHECPTCDEARLETEDGPLPIDRATRERIECSAPRIDEQGHVIAEKTPKRMRDAMLARDGYRCRSCGSRRGLMAHHKVFRSHGGPTVPENLLTMCSVCHALIHEGYLTVEGEIPNRLRFLDRHGRELDGQARPGTAGWQVGGCPRGHAGDANRQAARASAPPLTLNDVPDVIDVDWWRAHEHLFEWNRRNGRLKLKTR